MKINSSGSTSVQIISKVRGRYKAIKTIGCSFNDQDVEKPLYDQVGGLNMKK